MWKVIGVMGWKAACCGLFEALIVPSYSFPFREKTIGIGQELFNREYAVRLLWIAGII